MIKAILNMTVGQFLKLIVYVVVSLIAVQFLFGILLSFLGS